MADRAKLGTAQRHGRARPSIVCAHGFNWIGANPLGKGFLTEPRSFSRVHRFFSQSSPSTTEGTDVVGRKTDRRWIRRRRLCPLLVLGELCENPPFLCEKSHVPAPSDRTAHGRVHVAHAFRAETDMNEYLTVLPKRRRSTSAGPARTLVIASHPRSHPTSQPVGTVRA